MIFLRLQIFHTITRADSEGVRVFSCPHSPALTRNFIFMKDLDKLTLTIHTLVLYFVFLFKTIKLPVSVNFLNKWNSKDLIRRRILQRMVSQLCYGLSVRIHTVTR